MFSSKQLTDEQKNAIREWAADGATMSDLQRRITEEFGHRITYMDTRFVILDLGITLKQEPQPEEKKDPDPSVIDGVEMSDLSAINGVTVSRDEITIPGTMFSGKVYFSDGQRAFWYVDDTGRLGLDPDTTGYRPSEDDIKVFQAELKKLLR
jgi:hypothetical protein